MDELPPNDPDVDLFAAGVLDEDDGFDIVDGDPLELLGPPPYDPEWDPEPDALARATEAVEQIARQTAKLWAASREIVEEAERDTSAWIDPRVQCTRSEARDYAVRAATADLAVRLHCSESSVRTMAEHARRLSACPTVRAAFSEGRIAPQVARIAAESMAGIPAEVWPEFGEQILAAAGTLPPARFRNVAHQVRDRVHRIGVKERHAEAAGYRRVVLDHDLEGMSWLSLHLPSEVAVQAFERIDTAPMTSRGCAERPGRSISSARMSPPICSPVPPDSAARPGSTSPSRSPSQRCSGGATRGSWTGSVRSPLRSPGSWWVGRRPSRGRSPIRTGGSSTATPTSTGSRSRYSVRSVAGTAPAGSPDAGVGHGGATSTTSTSGSTGDRPSRAT